jgi:hypothetical protein
MGTGIIWELYLYHVSVYHNEIPKNDSSFFRVYIDVRNSPESILKNYLTMSRPRPGNLYPFADLRSETFVTRGRELIENGKGGRIVDDKEDLREFS